MSAERGLRGQVLGGVAWASTASLAGRLVSLASLLVLARLLLPEHFGVVAAVLVYVTYVEAVADLGTSAALVYWPRETERAAQAVLLLNLASSAFWLAATWLLAPWLAEFFRQPAAEPMFRAVAFGFPLRALGLAHDALAVKGLRFRARVVPATGLPLAKAVVSIVLAWSGWGAWSLIWGHLAGLAAWSALLWWVMPLRLRLELPGGLLADLLRYGRGIVAVNALAVVVHHADLVVVGRVLGSTALGFYQMAFKLPDLSLVLLMRCVSEVLFPALSRLQQSMAVLRRAYGEGLELVALLALPSAVGLSILAEPLVTTVLGASWAPSIPILQALALYAGIRSLGTHAGDVLKATGRSGLLAKLAIVKAAIVVPALLAGSRFGLLGVAAAMAASAAVGAAISLEAASRTLSLPRLELLGRLRGGVATAAVTAAVLAAWMASSEGAAPWLRLLVGAGLGGIVVLGGLLAAHPGLVLALRSRTGGRAPAGLPAQPRGRFGRFVLPLDQPSVLAYFRRELATPHGWRERLAGVLGARREAGAGQAPIEELDTSLPPELAGAIAPVDGERWVLRQSYAGVERAQHVLFLFTPEGSAPCAVLKVRPWAAADPEARPLQREERTLRRLRSELPEPMRDSLPKPLGYAELEHGEALLLEHLPGRSAYAELRRAPWRSAWNARHLAAAAQWLGRFHAATTSSTISAADAWASTLRALEGPARTSSAASLPARLADRPVPLCAVHGDFWAGNLLLPRPRPRRRRRAPEEPPATPLARVVDWEHSGMGCPFDDVFGFPLSYALSASSGSDASQSRWLRRAFLDSTSLARCLRRYFSVYCAETGIDPELLAPFLLLHLETSPLRSRLRSDGAAAAAWRDLCAAARAGGPFVLAGPSDRLRRREPGGVLEVHP